MFLVLFWLSYVILEWKHVIVNQEFQLISENNKLFIFIFIVLSHIKRHYWNIIIKSADHEIKSYLKYLEVQVQVQAQGQVEAQGQVQLF